MPDEKKPKTRAERLAEREELEKWLASIPGMGIPTGGEGARDFGPLIEIRGEPLSETIIKERREARY